MKSSVDTAMIVNFIGTEYPFSVDVRTFDVKTRRITSERCVRNVIVSMYQTKVIDSFKVIGYYGIITRYLALVKRTVEFA